METFSSGVFLLLIALGLVFVFVVIRVISGLIVDAVKEEREARRGRRVEAALDADAADGPIPD